MEVHTIHFSSIDSTQTWAKTHARELNPLGFTFITADEQTAGKGRMGRQWLSPRGNLMMSLFFSTEKKALPNLSQIGALFLCEWLQKKGIQVGIKWPNDLIVSGKKLAGFVAETFAVGNRQGFLIGLGLNVNTPVSTDQPTTSLCEVTGEKWDLFSLQSAVIEIFQSALPSYLNSGFAPYHKAFSNLLLYKGEKVSLLQGEKTVEGILIDVNAEGALQIQGSDGFILTYMSGEIHTIRSLQ